ncbi:endonuclease/exonuclease/phosphatase family protein [Streptomyces boninensis]|uniref:endonuclease/exonuclease/phosphatase family protein n=1 Tax=Streptomyces boninensis TaxID=2039455 RepID=UPI003B212791
MALIGTWNLENLYRPGGPFGPPDKAAYEAKLDAIAAVVDRLRPDILAVQEVGDPGALADLATHLGTGDPPGSWHTALSAHPDSRGIRVGFLSRLPLAVVADTDAFPPPLHRVQVQDFGPAAESMGRGALAVRAEPAPGAELLLICCHLKSKLLSFPGGRFAPRDEGERARYAAYALFRRAAEAAAVRRLADELLTGSAGEEGREGQDSPAAPANPTPRSLALLGDLNDGPDAATTQLLHGPPGSEFDSPGFGRPDRGDAHRLWNVAARIPPERRYSRVYRGRRELIDHVLLSHALLDRLAEVTAGSGAALPSMTDDPVRTAANGRPSDHAPVLARLNY